MITALKLLQQEKRIGNLNADQLISKNLYAVVFILVLKAISPGYSPYITIEICYAF
jgi:hypothetical protein